MQTLASTRRIEKGLMARGILPKNCRLVEISMTPMSALVVRYEVFVANDQLALFAEALKEAAEEGLADDERNRAAIAARPKV